MQHSANKRHLSGYKIKPRTAPDKTRKRQALYFALKPSYNRFYFMPYDFTSCVLKCSTRDCMRQIRDTRQNQPAQRYTIRRRAARRRAHSTHQNSRLSGSLFEINLFDPARTRKKNRQKKFDSAFCALSASSAMFQNLPFCLSGVCQASYPSVLPEAL